MQQLELRCAKKEKETDSNCDTMGSQNGYANWKKLDKRMTRKYPLRGYILDVLMHTTTWDGHCMKVRFAHFWSGVYAPALSYVALKE